eukprot:3581450-Amphidinium_carterae.1
MPPRSSQAPWANHDAWGLRDFSQVPCLFRKLIAEKGSLAMSLLPSHRICRACVQLIHAKTVQTTAAHWLIARMAWTQASLRCWLNGAACNPHTILIQTCSKKDVSNGLDV